MTDTNAAVSYGFLSSKDMSPAATVKWMGGDSFTTRDFYFLKTWNLFPNLMRIID